MAGWGLQGNGDGQSVTLLKTILSTVTNQDCKNAYGGKGLFSKHLCAYRDGKAPLFKENFTSEHD